MTQEEKRVYLIKLMLMDMGYKNELPQNNNKIQEPQDDALSKLLINTLNCLSKEELNSRITQLERKLNTEKETELSKQAIRIMKEMRRSNSSTFHLIAFMGKKLPIFENNVKVKLDYDELDIDCLHSDIEELIAKGYLIRNGQNCFQITKKAQHCPIIQ